MLIVIAYRNVTEVAVKSMSARRNGLGMLGSEVSAVSLG